MTVLTFYYINKNIESSLNLRLKGEIKEKIELKNRRYEWWDEDFYAWRKNLVGLSSEQMMEKRAGIMKSGRVGRIL